jgi:hypothetical protein
MARARTTPPPEELPAGSAATPPAEEPTTVIVQPAASPTFHLSPWAAAVGAALVASLAALGLAIAAFVTRDDAPDSVPVPVAQGFRGFAPVDPGSIPRFQIPPGIPRDLLPRRRG